MSGVKMVKIDYDRLMVELTSQKKSSTSFSEELGKARNYITNLKNDGLTTAPTEKIMCLLLGKEPGYFIAQDKPKEEQKDIMIPKILENIFAECRKAVEMLEQIEKNQDKILRKCNANTVQLERMKEALENAGKTEYDRALEFLKGILSGGRVSGVTVLNEADAAGIKRAELMKAKKELNVQTETSGYGKTQKSFWYLKY